MRHAFPKLLGTKLKSFDSPTLPWYRPRVRRWFPSRQLRLAL